MSFLELWGLGALIAWLYMTLIWVVSVAREDASIVDIFWGLGFVVLVVFYQIEAGEGVAPRQNLITILATIWGLRLSLHLFRRNRGRDEDYRYARWREQHGQKYWWYSYFQVFLLQGVVMWIVSAPLAAVHAHYEVFDDLGALDMLGVMAWTLGFFFEAVGDAHLVRFKRNPDNAGKVLDSGVWAYTRHPNYFGDALIWWGFFMIALAADSWWTVFSPLLMTWLLVRVSGVAMLERDLQASKPGYEAYAARTRAFIPWLPKD